MKRSLIGLGISVALVATLGLGTNLTFGQDTGHGTDVHTEVNEVLVEAPAEAETGASVDVTVTVLDANGAPVAGVECTFSVASQPGDDASVDAGPVTTDANGNATTSLDVGSSEGTIVVEADCDGVTATVSLVAGAAAAPPGSLPNAGTGAASSERSQPLAILLLAGLAVMLAAAGTLAVARHRGSRA